jgi:hypothetical protein
MRCWCSIDTLLTLRRRSFGGVAVLTHTILPVKAAKTSIMDKCCGTVFGLQMMHPMKAFTLCWQSVDAVWCSVDNLLTLCWRSIWGVAVSTQTILPIYAANSSIMDKCCITALGLYKMQHPKFLTLCWRSVTIWGWDHIGSAFTHHGCQDVDYRYQRASGIPMDLLTRPKTIDTPLTHTFRMCLLPFRFLFCL